MASSSFYLFLTILILIRYADTTTTTTETPPPTYPPPQKQQQPFKPGISVVIGVLTTMFSLTFLLLLYIKHCNTITSSTTAPQPSSTTTPPLSAPRKNSGIDRTVIQSLPIFRFGSLMGQKDGLDCAVCLTRFEPAELLRLLPKCKHAFHVECVDTWLDAHSTCPLCRHHVDPEDILLLHQQHHTKNNNQPQIEQEQQQQNLEEDLENGRRIAETRRISGRHSSVEGGILRVMKTASFRRSLDNAVGGRKKKENGVVGKNRKDGMLLVNEEGVERRLEHRIIVSPCMKLKPQDDERWSDVQPSDWLYLMSEKIIRQRSNDEDGRERGIITSRSVSELTGLSRFLTSNVRQHNQRQREEGLVSRWLAWISTSRSQSHTQPPVP